KADAEKAKNFNVGRFQNSAAFLNKLKQQGVTSVKTKEQLLNQPGGGNNNEPSDGDAVKAERNRIAEINAIVALVLERDKRDFSADGRKAIADGVSADEFSKALIKSDRYRAQFICSGDEDEEGGSPTNDRSLGALVVQHPVYQDMVKQGGLSKGQSVVLHFPKFNFGKYRKQFRPQAATPLTGLPGTAIDIQPQVASVGEPC